MATRRVVKVLYAVTAVPVLLWIAFLLYGIAKARYDSTPLGSSSAWFVLSFGLTVPWFSGLVGSVALARVGRQWVGWAVAMLIVLGVAAVTYFGWLASG